MSDQDDAYATVLLNHSRLTELDSRESLIVVLRYNGKSKQRIGTDRDDRARQVQKAYRDRERERKRELQRKVLELEDANAALARTNKLLEQENQKRQTAIDELETDLRRAYETRDALNMKLQNTEGRFDIVNASYLELQAQHEACRERFVKNQLRETGHQEENDRLRKEVTQLREREAAQQSEIASLRMGVELLKAEIRRRNGTVPDPAQDPYLCSPFWDPIQ
jgi:chromosome segregation ATPase